MSEFNHEPYDETTSQSSAATSVTIFETSTMYWKLCTIFLGIAFLVAIASHGGPASASANDTPNLLSFHQQQAAAIQEADATQTLTIGGFDSIDGQAAFVIVNKDGQRVGTLPMSAMGSD